ncbi:MAG: J domain-containing protein [Spirochaetota bacterium]
MDGNPFRRYLHTHPDANAQTLKELFRLLAKRTHPDLGAADADGFVRLQESYHEALGDLIEREVEADAQSAAARAQRDAPASRGHEPRGPAASPRERLFEHLYRYKALISTLELEPRDPPPRALAAFEAAIEEAARYSEQARMALEAFHEHFHRLRSRTARYPEVFMRYRVLMRGFACFFDHRTVPNAFNFRTTTSYLAEVRPVTDVDPSAGPEVRNNRSAAARSALYRMRTWLEQELATDATAEPPRSPGSSPRDSG